MMEYPKYKKVLFCADFSKKSNYAFEFACGIAKRDKGLLYILHVIPAFPHKAYIENILSEDVLKGLHKQIEDSLYGNYKNQYLKKVENGIDHEIVTKSGREDEEIIEFTKKKNVDIIIMGTHGRTGIEHIFLGSVAEKVLRRSPVPVLVIPYEETFEQPQ